MSPADPRRALPAVHALVERPGMAAAVARDGRAVVLDAARAVLEAARAAVAEGAPAPDAAALEAAVDARLAAWLTPRPRRVVNATGVVLHTNLGRAPLSEDAARAMAAAAAGYGDLEYDLVAGARGARHDLVAPLAAHLTGAEDALVLNNNAGATLLAVAALAAGRGVVVSRGELVEIGGGFRIPEILAAGGARLVEVGTTNRTSAADFAGALAAVPDIGAILRVHPSNFRILGFTRRARLGELVALGAAHGVPVVDDLGSGSLLDTAAFGLPAEPTVQGAVAAGADLVTFSGDKLLGGPQAGIVVGRAALVRVLRDHPLTRALRPDKATLAALAATLAHYARGDAVERIPVWRMLAAAPDELAARAAAWRAALATRRPGATLDLAAGRSTVGGGALPGATLPTTTLVARVARPDALAAALRAATPPVVARIEEGAVALDPRTVRPDEDAAVIAALDAALGAAP